MRIERIDDKTVKCFLSKEELDEYDISYKDFILRSDKAREVMEEIMMQAEEEVGFQPPKFAFELQIMVLPDQGMILTFSEKDPEDIQYAKDVKDCLNMIRDALGLKDADISKAIGMPRIEEYEKKAEDKAGKAAESAKVSEEIAVSPVTFAVFVFANIRDICKYAQVLPGNLRVKSALYEMNGEYYLYLDKGTASYERYSRACIRAMEFASLYTADEQKLEYIREHAECLIADHAVKKLKF